jgi:GTPase SAR1 family protein
MVLEALNEDTAGLILDYLSLIEILNLSLVSTNNILTTTSHNHPTLKNHYHQLQFYYKIHYVEKSENFQKNLSVLNEKMKNKTPLHVRNIVRIIFFGDPKVGKTLALKTFVDRQYDEFAVPDIVSYQYVNYINPITREIHNISYGDLFSETRKYKEKELRNICFSAHCYVLFYAINDRKSFENVKFKWYIEVKEFSDVGIPILLVASKIDLYPKDGNVEGFVSKEEGISLSKELRSGFIEITSKCDRESLENLIDKSILLSLYHNHDPMQSNSCLVQ